MRPRTMVAIAAFISGGLTTAVVFSPALYFAYDRPELHVVLETTEALIALLVVYLLIGRLRQSGEVADAVLVYGLAVLGGTNLVGATADAAVPGTPVLTWSPLTLRLIGAVSVGVAAFWPRPRRMPRRRIGRAVILSATITVGIITVLGYLVAPIGPELVAVELSAQDPSRPSLFGHPTVQWAQLLSTASFALASLGFLAHAEEHDDELMGWIAVSAVVNALARLNYFLFPSLYSEYVYSGDILRLASYLLLLIGASREIITYWRRAAESLIAEDRRRMARDLHDGVAQEISFITSQAKRLLRQDELANARPQLDRIASAGQRALDESRRAIDYLTQSYDEPLDRLLQKAAEQVAARVGARVRATLAPDVAVAPHAAEQLVRIVREAVTNATRHGNAEVVDVSLKGNGEVVVTITDDGSGFDVASIEHKEGGHYGLTSMRERAQAAGGILSVRSRPGHGTTVEVRVPSQMQSES